MYVERWPFGMDGSKDVCAEYIFVTGMLVDGVVCI